MIKRKEKLSMESKNTIMQKIFNELTEKNKDMMILLAKSISIAQANPKEKCSSPKQTA